MITLRMRLTLAILAVITPTLSHARGFRRPPHTFMPSLDVAPRPISDPQRTLAHMDLSARFAVGDRNAAFGWRPREDEIMTQVSRRITPNGPVGSLGLVRFDPRAGLDATALGNAIASRTRSASRRVGANLSFKFR
jgi:hypothetical protein